MHTPHPHSRLRLAVHAAHRAPRARGARLLRDPSADALAGVDPRVEARRHHPLGGPTRCTRRGRADGRSGAARHRAGARRLLRHAAHRPRRRRRGAGAARVRPRRDRGDWSDAGCSPASTGERTTVWMSHGDHVEEVPPGFVVTAHSGAPGGGVPPRVEADSRVQFHAEVRTRGARRGDHPELPVRRLPRTPDWTPGHFIEQESRRSASWSATRR
jgi:hypothetical protein